MFGLASHFQGPLAREESGTAEGDQEEGLRGGAPGARRRVGGASAAQRGKGLWIDGPRGGAAEGSGLGVSGPWTRKFPVGSSLGRSPATGLAPAPSERVSAPQWRRLRACGPSGLRFPSGSRTAGTAGALGSPPAFAAEGRPGPGSQSRGRDLLARGSGTASGQAAGLRGCPRVGRAGGVAGRAGQRPPGPAPATPRGVPRGRRPLTRTPLSVTAESGPVGGNRGCGTLGSPLPGRSGV